MPDITDPAAVKFCNEIVRRKADYMAGNYYAAKELVNQWNAQGLASLIPNDSSEVIDGARQDGRPVVTGQKITAIVTRCQEIVADYEATNNAKLNTVLQVAVTSRP